MVPKRFAKKQDKGNAMQELFEIEWGQDFVGLGLSEAVPKFLHTNAKIKNRHMSKAHTSSLVFFVSHTQVMSRKSVMPPVGVL